MKRYDQISAIFWLFFAAYICIAALQLPLGAWRDPGPGFLPLASGIILGALSLVCYLQARPGKSDEAPEAGNFRGRWKKLVLVLGVLCAYAVLLETLGFLLSSFLFLLFLFRGIEPQKWLVSIGGSILASLLCYVVFELWLKTQLPRGIFGF